MKRKVIFALLVLCSVGMSSALMAQSTTKKKKKKKTTSAAAAATADSIAKAEELARAAAAIPPPPPENVIDTSVSDGLVAESTDLVAIDYPLDSTRPVDGLYKIPLLRGAKPFAFPKQNRNNIKFYKRLWRTIDLRDSANQIFAIPGETLMQTIMDAIKGERIIAYKDEGFKKRMTYDQVVRAFSDSVILNDIDSLTGEITGSHAVFNPFNPDSVLSFELKEDIFFDKTRGRLVTTMVGLAPIKRVKNSSGDVMGEQRPFWLYFPQCRVPFASREIFDTQHDLYNISYDDIFIQRQFKTQIVKESNPADLRIKDVYQDIDKQKAESDRIERELENFKRKIWKY